MQTKYVRSLFLFKIMIIKEYKEEKKMRARLIHSCLWTINLSTYIPEKMFTI